MEVQMENSLYQDVIIGQIRCKEPDLLTKYFVPAKMFGVRHNSF